VNHSENASLSQYLLSPRRAYPILINVRKGLRPRAAPSLRHTTFYAKKSAKINAKNQ